MECFGKTPQPDEDGTTHRAGVILAQGKDGKLGSVLESNFSIKPDNSFSGKVITTPTDVEYGTFWAQGGGTPKFKSTPRKVFFGLQNKRGQVGVFNSPVGTGNSNLSNIRIESNTISVQGNTETGAITQWSEPKSGTRTIEDAIDGFSITK